MNEDALSLSNLNKHNLILIQRQFTKAVIFVTINFSSSFQFVLAQVEILVNYLTYLPPEHKHRAMHLSTAFLHLQCLVHNFLQPQWISSWYDFAASGRVALRGCPPAVFGPTRVRWIQELGL